MIFGEHFLEGPSLDYLEKKVPKNDHVWREQTIKKIKLMNETRKSLGMDLIKYGDVSCLKCHKTFFSPNKKTNRICLNCLNSSDFN